MNDILLHKINKINSFLMHKYKNTDIHINKSNTLFILDWDDTLFPTTWVTRNKIDLINAKEREQMVDHFQSLDRSLSIFLRTIMIHGKVIIITNAAADWVKISSIVMPITFSIIKKISIISARTMFGNNTNSMMDWKKLAFQHIIDIEYSEKKVMNVISIGDAEYEYRALISLSSLHMSKIKYLKSFRLVREPHFDHIIDQINVLCESVPKLWDKPDQICKKFVFYE